MSSETEDSQDDLQPDLQSSAPSEQDGILDGATTTRYCKQCARDVMPVGKGQCPHCGVFMRLNFVARRHPVNVSRCEMILADLCAQFPPRNVLERADRQHLASTLEQLENMRPGTPEWQRLIAVANTLGESLRASAPSTTTTPRPFEHLSPAALVAEIDALAVMARQVAGVGPARPSGAPDGAPDVGLSGAIAELPALRPEPLVAPALSPSGGNAPESAPAESEPAKCPYCYQSPTGCEELKISMLDRWRLFHSLDPEEIKRKDAYLQEEFWRMLGRPRVWPL